MAYTNRITTAVVAHPGHPCRRNQPCTGATAITMINAMNAGPINHAIAWIPATTTTRAAAPMRMIKARGRPAPDIPVLEAGAAAGVAGVSPAEIVTQRR